MSDERAAKIRLLLFDVDGVLTNGTILLHADGSESKVFDIKDGTAIVWALRLGLTVGLLSARNSVATAKRAAQLGVTLIHQGVANKLESYEQIAERFARWTDIDIHHRGAVTRIAPTQLLGDGLRIGTETTVAPPLGLPD